MTNYIMLVLALGSMSTEFKDLHSQFTTTEVIEIPMTAPLTEYRISSTFGERRNPFNRAKVSMHNGIDMPSPAGTPIYATASGVVTMAKVNGGYGNMVEINHGGTIVTRYAHMSEIKSKLDSIIKKGDIIGHVGSTGKSTGNHLHYEIRIDGKPVDPLPFLKLDKVT